MKSPLMGLAVATVAFAGSTIYLGSQLIEERDRAAEVTELARQLNARIAELEKAREESDHRHSLSAAAASEPHPATAANGIRPPSSAELDAEGGEHWGRYPGSAAADISPERTAVYEKIMKAQFRASTRRSFAELGKTLGLSNEEEKKLIDLLIDQQMASTFLSAGDRKSIEDQKAYWEQKQQEHQAQIVDLIGAEKADALRKYQEAEPARGEVEMIANQLEGSDLPLKDEQRSRLVAVVAEERARVPMPEYRIGAGNEKFTQAVTEWQDDYEQRVNAQARNILSPAQLAAYSEYQQWQREMRQQFFVNRPVAAGDAVVVFGETSAGMTTSPAVPVPASAPETQKK